MSAQVFSSFYFGHCTLIDYLAGIRQVLYQPSDQSQYIDLLHKTIVCYHGNKRVINSQGITKGFSMDEVIQRVIYVSCHSVNGNGCNVLSLGYEKARNKHNSTGCAPLTAHNIVNEHPNSSVALLLSRPWKTLHSRIGDDLMIHLLKDVSLFVMVQDSCYIQVSGWPMYSLEELSTHKKQQNTETISKSMQNASTHQRREQRVLCSVQPNNASVSSSFAPEPTTANKQKHLTNKSVSSLQKSTETSTVKQTLDTVPVKSLDRQEPKKYCILDCPDETMEILKNGMSENTVYQEKTRKERVEGYQSLNEEPCGINVHKIKSVCEKRKHSFTTPIAKKQKLTGNFLYRHPKPQNSSASEFNSKIFCCYFPQNTLLYSTNFKDKFPKKHILSFANSSNSGATTLIRDIFFDGREEKQSGQKVKKTPKPKFKIQRLPKRFLNMKDLFRKVLHRHKRCRFDGLLKHHCNQLREVSANSHKNSSTWNEAMHDIEQYQLAVQSSTPTYQVCRFIKAVCNRVIPNEFWGTKKNKMIFYKNLEGFIKLKKHERFSLGQMVDRVKIASCSWQKLSGSNEKGRTPLSESEKQKEVFYRWIWWLVRCYIMVILKSFFYITEGSSQTKEIFFYRKPVWRVIQDKAVMTMKTSLLRPITSTEALSALESKDTLGYSYMRFLPKISSVRPITNMRMKTEGSSTTKIPLSINSKLRNVFEIMKFENAQYEAGSTVFGVDDVYRVLKMYHTKQANRPLYMVHVDIDKCFDSILLDKLFSIMKRVFKKEEYVVRKYVVVKKIKGKARKIFEKKVTVGEDCRMFHELVDSTIKEKGLKNVVFVDQVSYIYEERDHILEVLKKHLFQNIVKIGSNFYKQVQGIPQGSILSNFLCSYFYNDMEKRCLKEFVNDKSSLLMRWVDDFLFMTPDQSMAEKFLTVMNAGIPKYGCRISTEKTLVNYHTATGIPVRRIEQVKSFPWCGFLIHPYTLNVQSDYSRYKEIHIKNSFVSSLHSQPGHMLFKRLSFSLRHKCHPILLDLCMNAKDVVLVNLYETFYWLAGKCYWWCREFPCGRQIPDNPVYLSRIIISLPPAFCCLARRKFSKMTDNQESSTVSDDLITWICYQAFIRCLKRKPLFKSVVRIIRKHSIKLKKKIEDCPKLHYNNPVSI